MYVYIYIHVHVLLQAFTHRPQLPRTNGRKGGLFCEDDKAKWNSKTWKAPADGGRTVGGRTDGGQRADGLKTAQSWKNVVLCCPPGVVPLN